MKKETKQKKQNKVSAKTFLLLHLAVFVMSISSICAKMAGKFDYMSLGFIAFYAGVIMALGVYALIWQQVLRKMPLAKAFVNKSAILVWSFIWGIVLFGENITAQKIIGILIVFCGVYLVVSCKDKKESTEETDK